MISGPETRDIYRCICSNSDRLRCSVQIPIISDTVWRFFMRALTLPPPRFTELCFKNIPSEAGGQCTATVQIIQFRISLHKQNAVGLNLLCWPEVAHIFAENLGKKRHFCNFMNDSGHCLFALLYSFIKNILKKWWSPLLYLLCIAFPAESKISIVIQKSNFNL